MFKYNYHLIKQGQTNAFKENIMTDLNKIVDTIKKINSYCKEIDALNASINSQYQAEDAAVKQSADKLIAYMRHKFETFKAQHFDSIKGEIGRLVNLLCEDYSDEYNSLKRNSFDFSGTFEENEKELNILIGHLNSQIGRTSCKAGV